MALLILKNEKKYSVRNTCGFTLLEVMIAVAILAITLTVLYGSQTQSLSLAAEAKFNTTASFLMTEKLAEIDGGVTEAVGDEGDFGEDYPGFKWKIESEEAPFDGIEVLENLETPLKHVIVTISWSDSPFRYSVDYYVHE